MISIPAPSVQQYANPFWGLEIFVPKLPDKLRIHQESVAASFKYLQMAYLYNVSLPLLQHQTDYLASC
jgi:hypothetical protein